MKRLTLVVSLFMVVAILSSCAYMPLLGYSLLSLNSENDTTTIGVYTGEEAHTASTDTETVTISKEAYERYQQFDELMEILDVVELYFYEEVDTTKLLEGAASGMLSATNDPYTYYYNPEAYKELWEDDEGEYAGVGIQITSNYKTQICTISRVFKGSPAEAAGVKKGDILYKVEDLVVYADNVNDAVDIMRGTPGTDVHVTFLRGEEQMEYDLTRAKITVNRVSGTMLDDSIGYIYLYEFAGECAEEFAVMTKQLVAEGAKGIMIDLRDNPGGWVQSACDIADLFVDAGTLCYLQYNNGEREYYRTKNGKNDVELVILMNENSASSSEILAGCLQDRADATVVGVQSYGKGIVQSVVALQNGNGSGMQLTIAQYFTPNGNAVHKIGITPNVESALPEGDVGDYDFADLNDPQLQDALRVMREKLSNVEVPAA